MRHLGLDLGATYIKWVVLEGDTVTADGRLETRAAEGPDGVIGRLARVGRDQTLVDLPYPDSATAVAARDAGARVLGGLEVLVAQGAASFELWNGVPAPVDVMRRAVGLTRAEPDNSG